MFKTNDKGTTTTLKKKKKKKKKKEICIEKSFVIDENINY